MCKDNPFRGSAMIASGLHFKRLLVSIDPVAGRAVEVFTQEEGCA